ncbi:hypothetical protein [Enterococcus faecalis]|uniref:hypothetical protein n=1 Tax=Enterococcus faecalis TaxID=1351 RepID=UPI001F562E0F|nr:hypothetical protein [Enterococcus faecalis]
MSKVLKWLETESERLEKECDTNDDQFKTVNHSFIQGFNYALANVEVIELEESKLNENQQIVLDWLKANVEQDNASPMCAVFLLGEWQTRIGSKELRSVDISYCSLNPKQQAEVLQAFSQWSIEQEEAK